MSYKFSYKGQEKCWYGALFMLVVRERKFVVTKTNMSDDPSNHKNLLLYLSSIQRGVLAQLARKTYLIYIHSNPNCPCTPNKPDLHTLLPQFCMYVFRTHTREAILHVHIWPTHTQPPMRVYNSAFFSGATAVSATI